MVDVQRTKISLGAIVAPAMLALSLASCGGKEQIRKPVAEGPNINIAVRTCNFDRVKELIEDDPGIIERREQANFGAPIQEAVVASRICGASIFHYLLEKDPQVNVVVLNDALNIAAGMGDADIVSQLLRHGADPNSGGRDRSGNPDPRYPTPLWSALFGRHLDVAQQLIAAGAKPDIFAAAAVGNIRLLREMLAHNPQLASTYGRSNDLPIDWARHFRQREAAKVLLEYTKSPELKDWIAVGDLSAVKNYLDHHPGAAAAPDDDGRFPLQVAIDVGDKDIATVLLERGANVNTRRLIQGVIQRGDTEMVKFLIEHGVDVKDKPGQVPLVQIAIASKHPEIAELIRRAQ